jgi:hypothetical protein
MTHKFNGAEMKNLDMPAMPCDVIFGKAYPENYDNTGLTKREHFAGLALQSLIASIGAQAACTTFRGIEDITDAAYAYADAMCKAGEK